MDAVPAPRPAALTFLGLGWLQAFYWAGEQPAAVAAGRAAA